MRMIISAAYIEVTNVCNLNCHTCYNRSGLNHICQELSVDALSVFIGALYSAGCRRVIYAGGEPTLHSRYSDLLALADRYPDISFGITSNGVLCPEAQLRLYKDNPLFTVQISVDGSCETVAAKTRGKNAFTHARETVRILTQANPSKRVTVKTVLSQANIDDTEAFYRWAMAEHADPEYSFINRMGNGEDDWKRKELTAQQKLSVLKKIDSLNREFNHQAQLPSCTNGCSYGTVDPVASILVKSDGGIYPCQMLYDQRFELINIQDFTQETFDSQVNRFVAMVAARKKLDFDCSHCLLRAKCQRGCIAHAVNFCGDPFGADGECEYRKIQFVGFDILKSFPTLNEFKMIDCQ